jgi:hypothetical protein
VTASLPGAVRIEVALQDSESSQTRRCAVKSRTPVAVAHPGQNRWKKKQLS